MFNIGKIGVQESVATARFACDLGKCKGACCTLPGGMGAPLDQSEVEEIRNALPHAKQYLSPRHLEEIERRGFHEVARGEYYTTCVDDKACVFVFYEEGIAKCSLEKAFNAGATTWRKPISCHLFPIRVSRFNGEHLRYEVIRECAPAVERGEEEHIPLHEFLREPLVRKYGQAWYDEFQESCKDPERRNLP
jgi:hypothetical protein